MADKNIIDFQVEADASDVTRSARQAVEALRSVAVKVGDVEAAIAKMFKGSLPEQLKQLEALSKQLNVVKASGSDIKGVRNASQTLARGTTETQLSLAALQAFKNTERADGIRLRQEVAKELRKSADARESFYREVRSSLPQGEDRATAFQSRLKAEGARVDLSKLVTEMSVYEARLTDEAHKGRVKRTAEFEAGLKDQRSLLSKHQRQMENLLKRDFGAIFLDKDPQNRRTLATQSIDRIQTLAGNRGLPPVDRTRLEAVYNQAEERRTVRDAGRDNRSLESSQRNFDKAYSSAIREDYAREQSALQAAITAKLRGLEGDFGRRLAFANLETDQIKRRENVEELLTKYTLEAAELKREGNFHQQALNAEHKIQLAVARREARPVVAPKPDRETDGGLIGRQAALLANYAALGGVIASFSSVAGSTIELQKELKQLQAITQSTNGEMASLTKTIFEVGNSTNLSLKDITAATTLLGQAGYSAGQIREALPAVAQLATAVGTSGEEAGKALTSVLSVYDLSIERSQDVANKLAQALNSSKLDFEQLQLGIQYAANTAAQGGVSFEEMTAALGAMSDAGIKSGSILGTGLRNIIDELQTPSKKFTDNLTKMGLTADDVSLETQSLYEVLEILQSRGFSSAAAMESFGKRAGSAFIALSGNLSNLQAYTEQLQHTTAASDAAAIQMESLASQFTRLSNNVVELTTTAGGPFLATLASMVGMLASLTHAATGASTAFQLIGTVLASLAVVASVRWIITQTAALKLLTGGVGAFSIAYNFAMINLAAGTGIISAVTIGIRAFTAALLASPLVVWTAGLSAAVLAFDLFAGGQRRAREELEKYQAAASEAKGEVDKYSGRMSELNAEIDKSVKRHARLAGPEGMAALPGLANSASERFGQWGFTLQQGKLTVDGYILSLIQLRAEMAQVAIDKAKIERSAVVSQQRSADANGIRSGTSSFGNFGDFTSLIHGNSKGRAILRDNNLLDVVNRGAVAGLRPNGDAARLLQVIEANPRAFGAAGEKVARSIRTAAVSTRNNSFRVQNLDQQISDLSLIADPGFVQLSQRTATTLGGQQDSRASILANYKGQERTRRLAAYDAQVRSDSQALKIDLDKKVLEGARDPVVIQLAARARISPEEFSRNRFVAANPHFGQVFAKSGLFVSSNNPDVIRANIKEITAQTASVPPEQRPALRKKKAELEAQLYFLQNPDADPEAATETMDAITRAGGYSPYKKERSGGQGDRTQTRRATTLTAQIKDAERGITNLANSLGPNPMDQLFNTKRLEEALDTWESLKRDEITASAEGSGASAEDLKDRLEVFNSEAEEYRAKVLNGNFAGATSLLATQGQRYVDEAVQKATADVTTGTRDYASASLEVRMEMDRQLNRELEASRAQFMASNPGVDPALNATFQEEQGQITRTHAVKVNDFLNELLKASSEAALKAITNEVRPGQLTIDRLRAKSGGSAKLDLAEARLNLRPLQAQSDAANRTVADLQNRTDSASGDEKDRLTLQLEAAKEQAAAYAYELERARIAVEAMANRTPEAASAAEVLGAAWANFVDQSPVNKPWFQQLSEGLSGTFETVRSGMASLVKDVFSGTKSIGDAFKDLGMKIVESLLDMAAQIIANKILLWVLSMISGKATGTDQAPTGKNNFQGPSFAKMATGGLVRGQDTLRDSVKTLLRPGEFVMRKSAVDMIGRDKLAAMNIAGNTKVSQMSSVGATMAAREPDIVNVYAVAPDRRPPPSKNDILAILHEDIMTGGRSKQLIKQVMVGAV